MDASRRVMSVSRILPRVDDECSARLEMPRVAGHDVESVSQSRRGEEPVGTGDDDPLLLGSGRQFAPNPGRFDVNRQNPVGILVLHPSQPRAEEGLLPTGGEQLDAETPENPA